MKVRSHLLDELGDPDAPVGSRLWCLYVSNEIRKAYYDKTQVGARLKRLVETFAEHHGWHELGYLTWEKFCEARLQIAADKIETEARNRVVEKAENTPPLAPNGTNQHTLGDYNCNPLDKGNSADYLTARIARDNPEVLEGMKQGKYRSVRSAAIAAGIIDPEKTKRHQLPTDPTAAGKYLSTAPA